MIRVLYGRPDWLAEAFFAALTRFQERGIHSPVIEGCTNDNLASLYSPPLSAPTAACARAGVCP